MTLLISHRSLNNAYFIKYQHVFPRALHLFPDDKKCIRIITGYNQSVTGCGSQRRECSCYTTKTYVNSMLFVLKLNLTSLRNIYIKSGLRLALHTF